MGIGLVEVTIIAALLCWWLGGNIARKAGFSRWFSLLLLVPLVNLVVIWMFAFSPWPNANRAP